MAITSDSAVQEHFAKTEAKIPRVSFKKDVHCVSCEHLRGLFGFNFKKPMGITIWVPSTKLKKCVVGPPS